MEDCIPWRYGLSNIVDRSTVAHCKRFLFHKIEDVIIFINSIILFYVCRISHCQRIYHEEEVIIVI